MSDINILVDATQVVGGQKALDALGVTFGKLVTKIVREGKQLQNALEQPFEVHEKALMAIRSQMQQTSAAAARENQKIVNSLLGVTTSYKSAEQSADAFSEVLMNQEIVARRVSQTINSLQGIGGPTATQSGASFSAMEGELERLTVKYNQVYGASKVYEKSLVEVDRAHLLGVISAKQHAAAVDSLNTEYQQFQAGTATFGNRFAQQASIASRQTNQLGVVVQQTGYQVGDFLVQWQSGTNWMVAFGQQATQLVGTLPLLATSLGVSATKLIAISTGLGIAIPLVTAIGAYFMRAGEQTNTASNSLTFYEEKLKSLDSTLKEWLITQEAAKQGLTVDQLISQDSLDKAVISLGEAKVKLNELSTAAALFAQGAAGGIDLTFFGLGDTANEELEKAVDAYAAAVDRLVNLRNRGFIEAAKYVNDENQLWKDKIYLQGISNQYGEDSSRYYVENLKLQLESYRAELLRHGVTGAVADALVEQKKRYEDLLRAGNLALVNSQQIKAVLNSITSKSITVAVNFQASFSNFTGKAAGWAGGVWDTMKDMAVNGSEPMFSSPKPRSAPTNIDFGVEDSGGSSGGGGSGGGSTTTLENKMEEIYKYLELEEYQIEQEKIAHKQREEILKTALDNKIITLEEYNKLEKAMVEQHNMDLLEIEMRTKNTRLTELSGMFGQLAGIMQSGGSKTAKIAATFGAVEATINSYVAATDALRKATTIPGKIAAYASVLATGLKGVAAIRAAGGIGGGSSGGGGPSASTVSTAAGSPDPQTVYIDSIDPESLYSGQTLINLFDAFYGENDKRGKVFVVAR